MGAICEDSVYRLTTPEALLNSIRDYLRHEGCEVVKEGDGLRARCGECFVTAQAHPLGHTRLISDLGTLGELAAAAGAGDVHLRVVVSEGCEDVCEGIRWRALMRGGG